MASDPLPVDAVLPALLDAIRRRGAAVLRAPPGAGKTTRVPPALLDSGDGRAVYVLEPRRIAARAAARRVAEERGSPLGGEVGYEVRFDRRAGPRTLLRFVTDGVFLNLLRDDPFLEGVSAVVFDEFHERNLEVDLSLALARRLQREVRSDLRIVVMSATIAAGEVAAWLGGCPVIESEGRLHPVEIRHAEPDLPKAVRAALDLTAGDVLVFLPGVGEIRGAARDLEPLARARGLDLVELFGDLPPGRQDAALLRGARRKVILSTNVAETSVTVENVSAVVDGGLARLLVFDPATGLDRLEVRRISRASADQRAGRAGRTGPGLCLRLWSPHEDRSLAEREEPEVRRTDVCGAVLHLLCEGEKDPAEFPWFEAPRREAIAGAMELLRRLGALGTPLGREMSRLPAHPRLARLLVEGRRRGCPARAALAAALLSERDPFPRGPATHRSDSDLLDRVLRMEEFEAREGDEEVRGGAARLVLRARDQYLRLLRAREGAEREEDLLRCVAAAWPDRIARRRERGSARAVMLGGSGVRLGDESAVRDAPLFVCVDVDARRGGEAIVRQASLARAEWLEPKEVATDLEFDPERKRVVATRRTRYGDLVLEEAPAPLPPGGEAAAILEREALRAFEEVFPRDEPGIASLLARVAFLADHCPEADWPDFSASSLREILPALCAGRAGFDELRGAAWIDFLRARLSREQARLLDAEAPERILLPGGKRVRVEYEPGKPPFLRARIQDFLGMARTPRLARGRVALVLHLLAPNGRPQQVTDDLESFWRNTYPGVRRALKPRYPKHAWPERPNGVPE